MSRTCSTHECMETLVEGGETNWNSFVRMNVIQNRSEMHEAKGLPSATALG
jgi:hypothetical protein